MRRVNKAVYLCKCIAYNKDRTKFNSCSFYLLDDSSEGDAFLCQPVRQRGLSEGVSWTVNSASVGKFVLLLQDDQSSLYEALTG